MLSIYTTNILCLKQIGIVPSKAEIPSRCNQAKNTMFVSKQAIKNPTDVKQKKLDKIKEKEEQAVRQRDAILKEKSERIKK